MNTELLQQSVGEIDETYIEEAHAFAAAPAGRSVLRRAWLIAACVALLGLLAGGVYAAASWFSAANRTGYAAADPFGVYGTQIDLEKAGKQHYVGFRIEDELLAGAPRIGLNRTLRDKMDRDWVPAEVLDDPALDGLWIVYAIDGADGERLQISMLDVTGFAYRSILTQVRTEEIRRGELNGMDAVWLHETNGLPVEGWFLLLHPQEPDCIVAIASNRGFEQAEAAAEKLRFVDTGCPGDPVKILGLHRFAFREPNAPEADFTLTDLRPVLLEGNESAAPEDPEQDLPQLYTEAAWSWNGKPGCRLRIRVFGERLGFDGHSDLELLETKAVRGLPAKLYRNKNAVYYPMLYLVLENESEGFTLLIEAPKEAEEAHPGLLEDMMEQLQIEAVEITEPLPTFLSSLLSQ